ncbi:hypothetical protein [uncultured Tenacibaculum sp.]|uniref:hypothetical protein n=1 Tax=uncultured Tenacibaculum sp. TaxID=174713 RepID=UPI002616449F|nr:hypothetical protein [uncultured Tenacibaculum sp.]
MTNTINITKCDNQLILIAVNNDNTNETVEICNIKSGNNNSVNVTINLKDSSSASETIRLNGLQQNLDQTLNFEMPQGNYSLIYMGVNWGGPYNFQFSFNDRTYELLNDPSKSLDGSIWNLGNLDLKFKIAQPATV